MSLTSVILYKQRTKSDFRSLTARLSESGNLRIEGHDIGSGVEELWGRGLTEYEWLITVRAAQFPRLLAALGGHDGDDILVLLSQRYSEDAHYASQTFFDQQGIANEFSSRVGD